MLVGGVKETCWKVKAEKATADSVITVSTEVQLPNLAYVAEHEINSLVRIAENALSGEFSGGGMERSAESEAEREILSHGDPAEIEAAENVTPVSKPVPGALPVCATAGSH